MNKEKDVWEEFDKAFVIHGGVMPRHRDAGKILCRELKSFISQNFHPKSESVLKEEVVKILADHDGCGDDECTLQEDLLSALDIK